MKVAVTGAAGLIGYEVVTQSLSQGHEVTGFYKSLNSKDKHKDIEVIAIDLLDGNLSNYFEGKGFDVVVHCAAAIPYSFGESREKRIAEINRQIDSEIISLCLKNRCRLIYLSSASVYGFESGKDLVSEESPVVSTGYYIEEKLWAEEQIQSMCIPSVILRVNAPYGPRQRSQTVLKTFIENALSGKDLYYYGTGNRTQDFTSCIDIANAVCQAVERPDAQGVFNIASGQPISMKDLATLVVKLSPGGTKSKVYPSGTDDNQENFRAMFDIYKAQKLLLWAPKIDLSRGIYEWYSYLQNAVK